MDFDQIDLIIRKQASSFLHSSWLSFDDAYQTGWISYLENPSASAPLVSRVAKNYMINLLREEYRNKGLAQKKEVHARALYNPLDREIPSVSQSMISRATILKLKEECSKRQWMLLELGCQDNDVGWKKRAAKKMGTYPSYVSRLLAQIRSMI